MLPRAAVRHGAQMGRLSFLQRWELRVFSAFPPPVEPQLPSHNWTWTNKKPPTAGRTFCRTESITCTQFTAFAPRTVEFSLVRSTRKIGHDYWPMNIMLNMPPGI